MNSYNIFQVGHESTMLFHAIATCEEHVVELANQNGIVIESDYIIELDKSDIKDQLGRPFAPKIEDAQVY